MLTLSIDRAKLGKSKPASRGKSAAFIDWRKSGQTGAWGPRAIAA